MTQQILRLGLAGRAVCLHSSLRSFREPVPPSELIDAFLDAGCTLLVPTFTAGFAAPPPAGHQPLPGNSEADGSIPDRPPLRGYTPESTDIDSGMGAVPATVLRDPACRRGNHPLSSFTALGPAAWRFVAAQSPRDVFAPLRQVAANHGVVLLIGVDLSAATLIHLAEEDAGLRLLTRWARDARGGLVEVRHGGCSRGFERLAPALAEIERRADVLGSRWRALPAAPMLEAATRVLAVNPAAARCADIDCLRCRDQART
ncbi:AAC(3) family N-acetyltransferase [Dactylosporangium sp. CA-233914]|uniref:AAC(3) family N-acetyltransferase n=1 Tax=Dactylosporangium sp. CA-233914 TaxID=3239934 RepID=UPI003D8F83CE